MRAVIERLRFVGQGNAIARTETYEATVYRAYLTVFMVGYGYANANWDRLMEETKIIHNVEQRPDPGQDKVSIPTMVDYEEWKQWQND